MTQSLNPKFTFENNSELETCPECKGSIIRDSFRGETICEQCGLIHGEKVIDLANFDKILHTPGEIRNKVHSGPFHKLFIATPSHNTKINSDESKNYNFRRATKLDNQFGKSKGKNLLVAISELNRMSDILHLPSYVKAQAMIFYRKALKKNITRGRSTAGMICACLYYVCRLYRLPISFKELMDNASINKGLVKKTYSVLVRTLKLKSIPFDPSILVARYINELKLSLNIEKKVLSVLQNLHSSYIAGKEPKSIVGAIIYLICKEENQKITQKSISKITGTCEASIRSKSKEIKKFYLSRIKMF